MCVTRVTGNCRHPAFLQHHILEIVSSVVLSLWEQVHPCISVPLGSIRERHFATDFHLLHWEPSCSLHGTVRPEWGWFGRHHQNFQMGKNMPLKQTCGLAQSPRCGRHNLIWTPLPWLYYHDYSIKYGKWLMTFNW